MEETNSKMDDKRAYSMRNNAEITEEVSKILSTLPQTATKFDDSSANEWSNIDLEKQENNQDSNQHVSPHMSSSESSSSDNEADESGAESSELDEEDCNRRRSQCIDEMTNIEKQFTDIRDQLYKERHTQISRKLEEVKNETATEYLQQLKALQEAKQKRIQVSSALRKLRISSLQVLLEAEKNANTQHLKNEKMMLMAQIQLELDEKIHMLEEDRENVDVSTELWSDKTLSGSKYNRSESSSLKRKKEKEETPLSFNTFGSIKRKKKPVTVTGPYVVYMLKDEDIVDDWAAIKKAINISQRRKRHLHPCSFEGGKLTYSGKTFIEGHSVVIKNRGEATIYGRITGLNSKEVLVCQNNGTKSKLHIRQLQRGSYTLQHR